MNNPVVERELTGMLRRGRTLAVQVIFASVLAAAVVLAWPHGGNVSLTGAQSQQVFRLFSYALLLGALVIAPAFPAVSLVREKQAGTLALLLNSPLTPRAIFAGKLLGGLKPGDQKSSMPTSHSSSSPRLIQLAWFSSNCTWL